MALCTRLAINYTNDLTLTDQKLLEASSIALHIDQGPSCSSSSLPARSDTLAMHAASLPLSVSEQHLALPRPQPGTPGLAVRLR